jgi:hypothetical protein
MRPARLFLAVLLAGAVTTCSRPTAPAAVATSEPPHCAKTFVIAITSSEATPGVWTCLSEGFHARLQGHGDAVFAVTVPLWSHFRYLGDDRNIAMFDLTVNVRVESIVYNPPVSHVIMAVYLDREGRVDHAKAATPT